MSITVVQHDQTNGQSGTNQLYFSAATPVTSGSTLLMALFHVSGTGTITSVTDAASNTWALIEAGGASDTVQIWVARTVTGFAGNITVHCSDGITLWGGMSLELAGCHASDTIQHGDKINTSTTSHVSSTTAISGTGIFVSVGTFSGTGDITMAGWTSYTATTGAGSESFYKIQTGVSETGAFTTSAAVLSECALAFIPEDAVTPPPTTLTWLPRQHILRGPRGLMTPSGPVPPTRPEP